MAKTKLSKKAYDRGLDALMEQFKSNPAAQNAALEKFKQQVKIVETAPGGRTVTEATVTTVSGTALKPGISRNGRYYSPKMIAQAVADASERIRRGDGIPMRSHHDAGDDSTRIVGKLTGMRVGEDGSAEFTATLARTGPAKIIGRLVAGAPRGFLNGVSIAGKWKGKPRSVTVGGQQAETADGLEIHSLDFTSSPGVPGAGVTSVKRWQETLARRDPAIIFEDAPRVSAAKLGSRAGLIERAEQVFDAEAAALRVLDECALSAHAFKQLREGRTSPMWAESSLAAKLDALGYHDHPVVVAARDAARLSQDDARDLAKLSQDDFEAAAAAWAGGKLADMDAARPRSPFMRGLDGTPAA